MTNLDAIAMAHRQFSSGDLSACEKTLARIRNNFALRHDEYVFTVVAKIEQPARKTAEKLIADGKGFLVGDAQYLADKAYLKSDIKTQINFCSNDPYFQDDEVRVYFNGHFRFDEEGIHTIVANGGASKNRNRKELKELIEKWLISEFGAVAEWGDDE